MGTFLRAGLAALLVFAGSISVRSQTSDTAGDFWPTVNAHVQFPDHLRLLGFVGLKNDEDFSSQQLDTGLGLGYQWKRISKRHRINIDPDKEHTFVLGGGYENLQTFQPGKSKTENRLVLEAMPGFRPASALLVRDRNRIEFRWVNGVYSTRYRNLLSAEYDAALHGFHFTPYATAEAFHDGSKNGWNEEQYAAGFQWPYKSLLMLETYYLRQNCTTCTPTHLNVAGLTLNFYIGNKK